MQLQTTFNPDLELDASLFRQAYHELLHNYDPRHGGFGDAPKFPSPHNLAFLLQRRRSTGDEKALEMVEQTLAAMQARITSYNVCYTKLLRSTRGERCRSISASQRSGTTKPAREELISRIE